MAALIFSSFIGLHLAWGAVTMHRQATDPTVGWRTQVASRREARDLGRAAGVVAAIILVLLVAGAATK